MSHRIRELEMKLRTPACAETEKVFQEDLCDLRVLVAKEFSTFVIGGDDLQKFHHMGKSKKMKSLTNKDERFFESFLMICVQLVWLALSRQSYNRLDVEIHRLFKTDIFNSVEHKLKTGLISEMTPLERNVFLGTCLRHDKKLNTRSPLSNEVFCHRFIDFRMFGLGTIKYTDETLSSRLRYMLAAIAAPEEKLNELGVSVGILGLKRASFDTIFQVLPSAAPRRSSRPSKGSIDPSKGSIVASRDVSQQQSSKARQSDFGKFSTKSEDGKKNVYDDIFLPPNEDVTSFPFPRSFPEKPVKYRACNHVQCQRWLQRLERLLHLPDTSE